MSLLKFLSKSFAIRGETVKGIFETLRSLSLTSTLKGSFNPCYPLPQPLSFAQELGCLVGNLPPVTFFACAKIQAIVKLRLAGKVGRKLSNIFTIQLILLKYFIFLIVIVTSNCLTATVKQKFPSKIYETTNSPIKLLEILESENFLKFIWEESKILKVSRNYRYKEEISESQILKSTCIKNPLNTNQINTKMAIELDFTSECPAEEKFNSIQFVTNSKLENHLYIQEFKLFINNPYSYRNFEAAHIEYNSNSNFSNEDVENIYRSTETDRIFLKLKNGKVLSFYPFQEWKNGLYFTKYSLRTWDKSDDFWFKKCQILNLIRQNPRDSTIVIFKNYITNPVTGRTELKNNFISVNLSNPKWKNKTITFANYEIKRNFKIGLAPFLLPLTIPIDIILSPVQLIYFGIYEYVFIISCSFGFTCKTALG